MNKLKMNNCTLRHTYAHTRHAETGAYTRTHIRTHTNQFGCTQHTTNYGLTSVLHRKDVMEI